ncbi:MAG TPA: type II toxin-antitoxin system RelE/ParE family toxin [Planctomycetota bacterium]|nr:type II toxin-antitoxin system RelE/ParE family toxin [Planctomycetota bacterium]
MREYIILPRALQDLLDTADYIHDENPEAAHRFLTAARETCERLLEFPYLGKQCFFQSEQYADFRYLPVQDFRNWRIIYKVNQDVVEIVRVMHAARDVENRLTDEPA